MNTVAIFALILIATISIAIKVMKNEKSRMREIIKLNSKSTKWMLMMYVTILVGLTIVAAFISSAKPTYEKVSDNKTEQFDDIYPNLSEGNVEDIPATLIEEEWTKALESNKFTIVSDHTYSLPLTLFIERVENAEGKVDASLYKGLHVINDYAVRDYMDDIELEWSDDKLTIIAKKNPPISMSFFQYDFLFKQLNDEKAATLANMFEIGPSLYLKIPESVELDVDKYTVHVMIES